MVEENCLEHYENIIETMWFFKTLLHCTVSQSFPAVSSHEEYLHSLTFENKRVVKCRYPFIGSSEWPMSDRGGFSST